MSDEKKGRFVAFSATMKPSARAFGIVTPSADGKSQEKRIAPAGSLLFRIMNMTLSERMEILQESATDEILVLFAMLTPKERRDILRAAESLLKQKIAEV